MAGARILGALAGAGKASGPVTSRGAGGNKEPIDNDTATFTAGVASTGATTFLPRVGAVACNRGRGAEE